MPTLDTRDAQDSREEDKMRLGLTLAVVVFWCVMLYLTLSTLL